MTPQILPITIYPSPILYKKSVKVEKFDNNLKKLADDLAITMEYKDGIGLAAPQVAKNIRIIVVMTKDGPIVFCNPVIFEKSLSMEWGEEGCLSIPNTFGEVKRHKEISVKFQDIKGKKKELKAKGLFARVIQHEVDHLEGILFIDKKNLVRNIKRTGYKPELF